MRNTLAAVLGCTLAFVQPNAGVAQQSQECVAGSILDYYALGVQGCRIGNVQFTGFNSQLTQFTNATRPDLSTVSVTPWDSGIGTVGFRFAGSISGVATPSQFGFPLSQYWLGLGMQVAALAPAGVITGFDARLLDYTLGSASSSSFAEATFASPGTDLIARREIDRQCLPQQASCTEGLQRLDEGDWTPVSSARFQTRGGGSASEVLGASSTTREWEVSFTATPMPVSTVTPEPMSLVLLGTGLASLGALRWRRRRKDEEPA